MYDCVRRTINLPYEVREFTPRFGGETFNPLYRTYMNYPVFTDRELAEHMIEILAYELGMHTICTE